MQANSKITELEAKLVELQQELTVLQTQDKRTPVAQDDPYSFSGSDSEPTSGQSSQKRKKGQAFPPAISYGGFFLSNASMSVLADEQMAMMPASSSQVVGSQTTLHLPASRIAPPWGKGDPPILKQECYLGHSERHELAGTRGNTCVPSKVLSLRMPC